MFGSQVPDIREATRSSLACQWPTFWDVIRDGTGGQGGELDRANLHEGQDAIIQLDAIANKRFHGRIKSMSATASASVFSADPARSSTSLSRGHERSSNRSGRQAGPYRQDDGHSRTEPQETGRPKLPGSWGAHDGGWKRWGARDHDGWRPGGHRARSTGPGRRSRRECREARGWRTERFRYPVD
jgi:hypothetical protein